jgi:protein TonB
MLVSYPQGGRMSLQRFTALGVVVSVTLAGAVLRAQDVGLLPGPLEKIAAPITPENPIPRRTSAVSAIYPSEADAIGATGLVTLRAVLDPSGRVAEMRRVNNPIVTTASAPDNPAAVETAGEAMVRAAAAALRLWQYDSPAVAPLAFDVTFAFRPGADVVAMQNPAGGRGIGAFMPVAGAATAQPLPPWEAAKGAVRVGGNVRPPTQVRKVNPAYPPDAQAQRVQGVVILEALIGADGRVQDARVLRSIPALDQAALDAVRQWEYAPTLLNGAPVPIVMTVTVQFTLS